MLNVDKALMDMTLKEMEQTHVTRVLNATAWHKGKTCKILGISRPRLRRMIKEFSLEVPPDVQIDDEDNRTQDDN